MRQVKRRSTSFSPSGSGIERLENLCLLSASFPADVSSTSPPEQGNSSSSGQQDPGAFLPDPNYDGDPQNAPLVTYDQFVGIVNSTVNQSWHLPQNDTMKRIGPDANVMTASLNADRQTVLDYIDERIADRQKTAERYGKVAIVVHNLNEQNQDKYKAMTPAEQQSDLGRQLRQTISAGGLTEKVLLDALNDFEKQINDLNHLKDLVNQAFTGAIASIRKDYSTSGGPGNEIYQNDNFYFV